MVSWGVGNLLALPSNRKPFPPAHIGPLHRNDQRTPFRCAPPRGNGERRGAMHPPGPSRIAIPERKPQGLDFPSSPLPQTRGLVTSTLRLIRTDHSHTTRAWLLSRGGLVSDEQDFGRRCRASSDDADFNRHGLSWVHLGQPPVVTYRPVGGLNHGTIETNRYLMLRRRESGRVRGNRSRPPDGTPPPRPHGWSRYSRGTYSRWLRSS